MIVSGISLPFDVTEEEALDKARRILGNPSAVALHVAKKSLDARKRNDIRFVYSVAADYRGEDPLLPDNHAVRSVDEAPLEVIRGKEPLNGRPVVVGFGPAGMFAGLMLAREGYKPVILEKGADMDARVASVHKFWHTGELNADSNVQFGEGGAGTFSDGKLVTRINDPRCGYVLREMHGHGAPEEILYQAKPHIGTDRLRGMVKSIRGEIVRLGGEVRFLTSLTGIKLRSGRVEAAVTPDGGLQTEALILAPGHSSRELFSMLLDAGVRVEPKPFSVGVRIEHRQEMIDRALYGSLAGHPLLPRGEYQLSHRDAKRAVYTFCMCPGGYVVPAASERGMVVTNGMSEYARNGENANSALVVSVDGGDFASGPLGGIGFQRELEARAYAMGGGGFAAPVQNAAAFLNGKAAFVGPAVAPTYARGVVPGDIAAIFPAQVAEYLRLGVRVFGRKLKGFDDPGATLTAVETRTSSPVRITRGDDMQSVTVRGLYPSGEGAGYAGGIVSAAVDGIRAAMAVISRYMPNY